MTKHTFEVIRPYSVRTFVFRSEEEYKKWEAGYWPATIRDWQEIYLNFETPLGMYTCQCISTVHTYTPVPAIRTVYDMKYGALRHHPIHKIDYYGWAIVDYDGDSILLHSSTL